MDRSSTVDVASSALFNNLDSSKNFLTEIQITADKFGGNYYLEASTLFRDQNGVDMPAEFIIPNCKIQSNFTFTMASSGDPSTFTFTQCNNQQQHYHSHPTQEDHQYHQYYTILHQQHNHHAALQQAHNKHYYQHLSFPQPQHAQG